MESVGPVKHVPVLARTLAERIILSQDAVMVDATVGQGGHSYLFGQNLGKNGRLICFDVNEDSLRSAREKLKDLECEVLFIRENFSQLKPVLEKNGIDKVDFIFADLGVSSAQLADISSGLSFQQNMPLDMRLDKRLKTTAADIVNRTDEKSLADIIYKYGEDRASRRIARFIVSARQSEKITTTAQLSSIACKALGQRAKGRRSKIHPATRTFQALRVAVNNELENLEVLLQTAPDILKAGGEIAVISFHSLEDRIVKYDFREKKADGIYEIMTKKPLIADREEIVENPRARSAKLRIARRCEIS